MNNTAIQSIQRTINNRLSLRPPQSEALSRFIQALQAAPDLLNKNRNIDTCLEALKNLFSTIPDAHLSDFERNFPSLCFALATGVGKTRLMGALISFLHLNQAISTFFVLAPNLTIYNKLIADFTPNTPKYVFAGLDFQPVIITGDNYEELHLGASDVSQVLCINIFNISKLNSEVRGGKQPKIKRIREVLGESYFDFLQNRPDLVLLMDESHRYRAQAGMRTLNELNPLLGLELTATPFVEGTANKKQPIPFKNVVMHYGLNDALRDGFIKEPAVATQRNFDKALYSDEELEQIKLKDGIRLHEATRSELLNYAKEHHVKTIKPFVLVIASDTTHAEQLRLFLESDDFFAGRYRGKVLQVDSSRSGAEEDAMISALLNVENPDEPTEIVIHVNMLKEGWDVTNLYTIIPLRAANAATLVVQTIGRGLRLPYGKRTGVDTVDRLTIVAHDRFQEILEEANKQDSPIRIRPHLIEPNMDDKKIVHQTVSPHIQQWSKSTNTFNQESERQTAQIVQAIIKEHSQKPQQVPTSKSLLETSIQQQLLKEVTQRLQTQAPLWQAAENNTTADNKPLELAQLIHKTTEAFIQQTLDIPRIQLKPVGEAKSGFNYFELQDLPLLSLDKQIIATWLRRDYSDQQFALELKASHSQSRPEQTLLGLLRKFHDIDYEQHASYLYQLAEQAINHYRKQYSEEELKLLVELHGKTLADCIHTQMQAQFWESNEGWQVEIKQGFSELLPCHYSAEEDTPLSVLQNSYPASSIRKRLFGGFKRCLYPLQKFDSLPEQYFARILERDAQKWFKPALKQLALSYRNGGLYSEYKPDFVVETEQAMLLVEIKAANQMQSDEVIAKASAASTWCEHAAAYSVQHDGKPWYYLLIPDVAVTEDKSLMDFLRYQVKPKD